MSLGERLKKWISDNYGSPYEAEKKTGIRAQQLYSYMAGRTIPDGKNLLKLYRSGCDINWLFGGESQDYEKLMDTIKEYREKAEKYRKDTEELIEALIEIKRVADNSTGKIKN